MKKAFAFRAFVFLAVMTIFAYPTFAQGGNRPGGGQGDRPGGGMGRQFTEDDIKQRVERQSELLGMNEEQEKKILDFELELYKKNQVERQNHQGDREGMRAYMLEQRKLRDEKYKEVLTEEQFEKYQKNQEERIERMQQRRDGSGTSPGDRPSGGDRPARGRGRG